LLALPLPPPRDTHTHTHTHVPRNRRIRPINCFLVPISTLIINFDLSRAYARASELTHDSRATFYFGIVTESTRMLLSAVKRSFTADRPLLSADEKSFKRKHLLVARSPSRVHADFFTLARCTMIVNTKKCSIEISKTKVHPVFDALVSRAVQSLSDLAKTSQKPWVFASFLRTKSRRVHRHERSETTGRRVTWRRRKKMHARAHTFAAGGYPWGE